MKKMTPTRTPAACGLKRLAIVPAAGADCMATTTRNQEVL